MGMERVPPSSPEGCGYSPVRPTKRDGDGSPFSPLEHSPPLQLAAVKRRCRSFALLPEGIVSSFPPAIDKLTFMQSAFFLPPLSLHGKGSHLPFLPLGAVRGDHR